MIWRDITQINAPGCVLFSADTPDAERWMRKRLGGHSVLFHLPVDYAKAVAFKEAAEAQNFIIVVLTRRQSAIM